MGLWRGVVGLWSVRAGRDGTNRVCLLMYIGESTELWPILNRFYLNEGGHGLLFDK